MDNNQVPPKADEKTKVISSKPPVPPQQAPKPNAQVAGTQAAGTQSAGQKPTQPGIPPPSPFASYFKNGNTKAKRTIVAGAVGGGLLVGMIALTSFNRPPEETEELAGGAAAADAADNPNL